MKGLVIDLGSNALKYTIADITTKKIIDDGAVFYGLLKSLDEDGNIPEEKVQEVIRLIDKIIRHGNKENIEKIVIIATEGLRKAKNSETFISRINSTFNLKMKVLSGSQEAKMAWLGATKDISFPGSYLGFDIGGGSTELTYGDSEKLRKKVSIPIGSTVLSNQFKLQPFTPVDESTINGMFSYLDRTFSSQLLKVDDDNFTMIGIAGASLNVVRIIDKVTTPTMMAKSGRAVTAKEVEKALMFAAMAKKPSWNDKIIDQAVKYATLLPSIVIVRWLMFKYNKERFIFTQMSLRHGVIYDE